MGFSILHVSGCFLPSFAQTGALCQILDLWRDRVHSVYLYSVATEPGSGVPLSRGPMYIHVNAPHDRENSHVENFNT
jgi:hypothetical protein